MCFLSVQFYENPKTIGIKACIAPQSSEHWPEKTPLISTKILTTEILAGIASTFTAKFGIAIAWITSVAETENKIPVSFCKIGKVPAEIPNKEPISRSRFNVWSDCSKIQYHCIPKTCKDELTVVAIAKLPEITSWFRAKVPAVGIINEKDSNLREEITDDIFVLLFSDLSTTEINRTETDTKIPIRKAQHEEEIAAITIICLLIFT